MSRSPQLSQIDEEMESFHHVTPLLYSHDISSILDADVYLKLENTQPSGSFKIRGMGHHCQMRVKNGATHLVGSSGGNAGIAMAYAASKLNVPITVYVPETTPTFVVHKLKQLGANVEIGGVNWSAANEMALESAAKPGTAYLHPFDQPDVWEGHSTVVEELKDQLSEVPSCIVTAVGGGGLLMGILEGLTKVGWNRVPVVAMETVGADCFNLSIKEGKIVSLSAITSIAKSLGASAIASKLFESYKNYDVISEVVTDAEAVEACINFANDHRYLVEPACGAALAALYSGTITRLRSEGHLKSDGPVVVIVCGGNGVTLDLLYEWSKSLGKGK